MEGALITLALARLGFKVDVYDPRDCPRSDNATAWGSSSSSSSSGGFHRIVSDDTVVLNVAALEGLKKLGVSIPQALTREVHGTVWHRGRGAIQLPMKPRHCLVANEKALLIQLLSDCEALNQGGGGGRVAWHWGVRTEFLNTDRCQVVLVESGAAVREVNTVSYQLLIGADGVTSTVRRCLADQVENMECEQTTGGGGGGLSSSSSSSFPPSTKDASGLPTDKGSSNSAGKLCYYQINIPGGDRDLALLNPSWVGKVHTWSGLVKVPMATQPATVHVQALPGPQGDTQGENGDGGSGSVSLTVGVPQRLVQGYEWKAKGALEKALAEGLYGFPSGWLHLIVDELEKRKKWTAFNFRHGTSTRCTTYHGHRTVIVGDAAHSMSPALLLGSSAAVQGALVLIEELSVRFKKKESGSGVSSSSLTDDQAVDEALASYTARWRHEAFSAVDMSEQMYDDLVTTISRKGGIPRRFREPKKQRRIERLTGVENLALFLMAKVLPMLFRPPGVWRTSNTLEKYSKIFRDMRRERESATGALALLGLVASFFIATVLKVLRFGLASII